MSKNKLYTDNSGWVRCLNSKEAALEYFKECAARYNQYQWHVDFATTIDEIKEVETPFKAEKAIYNGESYSEYCSDLLDNWLESACKDPRYVRPVREYDECHGEDNVSFVYTNAGTRLVERALTRLNAVGYHHYDCLDTEISSSLYREF